MAQLDIPPTPWVELSHLILFTGSHCTSGGIPSPATVAASQSCRLANSSTCVCLPGYAGFVCEQTLCKMRWSV